MYERILVPLDGSELAEVALPCIVGSGILVGHPAEGQARLYMQEMPHFCWQDHTNFGLAKPVVGVA